MEAREMLQSAVYAWRELRDRNRALAQLRNLIKTWPKTPEAAEAERLIAEIGGSKAAELRPDRSPQKGLPATGVDTYEGGLGAAISFIGWAVLAVAGIVLIFGVAGNVAGPSILLSFSGVVSGLLLVAAGRVTSATVEIAKLTKLILDEIRSARN